MTRRHTSPMLIAAASLALPALVLPQPAAAEPLVGSIEVRLDGYRGRKEVLRENLEIQFMGLTTRTTEAGTFYFPDLRQHGLGLPDRGRIVADDDARNFVRFTLGRQRLRLPVTWIGEARGDALVLYPMDCEIDANEAGGCFARVQPDPARERRLRQLYRLPTAAVETPAPPAAPEPARPATPEPAMPVRPVPSGPSPAPDSPAPVRIMPMPAEEPAELEIDTPIQEPVAPPPPPRRPADPGMRVIEPVR